MNDPIAKRLFQNAVNSVDLGLEDFELTRRDHRRYVSATRNLFAGMLLLFKSWLAENSADENYALLRTNAKETKKKSPEEWTDIAKAKTVGFDEMRKRIGEKVDWARIDKLHNYRNKIEHSFVSEECGASDFAQYLSQVFLVIRDFMKNEIGEDPAKCLSVDGWRTLFSEHDVHLQEMAERNEVIDSLEWVDSDFAELVKYKFICPNCGSEIVSVADDVKEGGGEDVRYTCRKCGKGFSYVDLCEAILPQCHCSVCDDSIDLSEIQIYLETGMCGWHAHVWEKEFAEDCLCGSV